MILKHFSSYNFCCLLQVAVVQHMRLATYASQSLSPYLWNLILLALCHCIHHFLHQTCLIMPWKFWRNELLNSPLLRSLTSCSHHCLAFPDLRSKKYAAKTYKRMSIVETKPIITKFVPWSLPSIRQGCKKSLIINIFGKKEHHVILSL